MIEERKANARYIRLSRIFGATAVITFVTLIITVAVFSEPIPFPAKIVLMILAGGVFIVGLYVFMRSDRTVGYYQCPDCKCCFVPTFWEYTKGFHRITTRRLTCPNCRHKVWAKKVMSRDGE